MTSSSTLEMLSTALPVERRTTASRVAQALRVELLDGLHPPGTPLRENELAARATVSRSTVREALAELARDGLVVHNLHRGMMVADLSAARVREIYGVRDIVESAGLTALDRPSRQQLGVRLAAIAEQMQTAEAAGRRRDVVDADAAFHSAISAGSGNRRIAAFHAANMLELRLVLSVVDRAAPDRQAFAHVRLAEVVRSGTLREARSALARHLSDAAAQVCGALVGE